MKKMVRATFVGLFAVIACIIPLSAQVSTADILGTVTDTSGAVLVGAKVTVENPATNISRTSTTDSSGNYSVVLLPAGRYNIKVENAGFRVANLTSVVLATGDRSRQDVRLEVGQATESVQVSAQAAALQSDSAVVGTLLTDRIVQDAPINGRNFVRLVQLAAGTTEGVQNGLSSGNRPDDRRRSSSVAVNGQRDYANSYLIDGLDNNERYIGTIVVKPSQDALQEFRIQTNSYAAEVGRTAGGVINLVTKSGTNTFHGSLFEFFRNQKLDSRNFFADPKQPNPPYKQNQFGGSIGGPIKKDKTFFFADYEALRLRQGLTYVSTVPTLAMRAGNFAGISNIFDPLNTVTVGGVNEESSAEVKKAAIDAVSAATNAIELYERELNIVTRHDGDHSLRMRVNVGPYYEKLAKAGISVRVHHTPKSMRWPRPPTLRAGLPSTSRSNPARTTAARRRVLRHSSMQA